MPRNILQIVIDCFRADHASCYGYHRKTSPTLDALARRGVLWEQAHSASCWTKPSVASLFTGLYPTQHGAFQGIKRSRNVPRVMTDVLQPSQPTLADVLTREGWRCGAFMNNAQLGEFTGLNRGFSTYIPDGGKADAIIKRYRDWLEADRQAPTYAYLHFLEAHWPYKPRRRHVAMFGGDRDTNEFRDHRARDFARLRRAVNRKEQTLSQWQLDQMIQLYDGALRRLDGKLRIILTMLEELGLQDETAVIVTADHGEEFMEHGRIGHGQSLLYDEVSHVPLVAFVPGDVTGVRRPEVVSQVDLPRTLLGIAGLGDELPGRDLLADNCEPRPVCSETRIGNKYAQSIRTQAWKLYRRYRFEATNGELDRASSPRAWITACPYELEFELYDMVADPRERCDLAQDPAYGHVRRTLTSDLDRWWQDLTIADDHHSPGAVEIDAQVVQRLRDLGYLD